MERSAFYDVWCIGTNDLEVLTASNINTEMLVPTY